MLSTYFSILSVMCPGLLYTGLCRSQWKATTKSQAELEEMENFLSVGCITPSESKIILCNVYN